MNTQRLFGYEFVSEANLEQVSREILRLADEGVPEGHLPMVITPNVDFLLQFGRSPLSSMGQRLASSAMILPDGQPIVWASRWLKRPLRSRLTGADLFPELWKLCVAQQRRVFMVLANEEVGQKLCQQNPNLRYVVPPFYSLNNAEETKRIHDQCAEIVKEFDPELIIMGISAPKQQHIGLDLFDRGLTKAITLYLGASMEFFIGQRSRAPRWMQRSGVESLHRLFSEPKRMYKRFFSGAFHFIPMVLRERRRISNP